MNVDRPLTVAEIETILSQIASRAEGAHRECVAAEGTRREYFAGERDGLNIAAGFIRARGRQTAD